MSSNKRFHIELEVDNVDSKERLDAVTEALQIAGRTLFTSAMLIVGDTPPPQITLWAEDFDSGRSKVTLAESD